MFLSHNGHSLSQMNDVVQLFSKDMEAIEGKLQLANTTNKTHLKSIEQVKVKLDEYREKQLKFIHDGFTEIFRRLEQKKMNLTEEFIHKYNEEQKVVDQHSEPIKKMQEQILHINKQNIAYKKMFDSFSQPALLRKFTEFQEYTKAAMSSLDDVISEVGIDKSKFEVNPDFKPLSINIDRAVKVIGNFKIEPPGPKVVAKIYTNEGLNI